MKDYVLSPVRRHDLKVIAANCRKFRKYLGIPQSEIAKEVCTSPSNISEFERGNNDSATIYNWYIKHGLNNYYAPQTFGK